MKKRIYSVIIIALLYFTPIPLSAQTPINKTIPNENDQLTEYYILEENADSTECYLYLFDTSRSYMLIVNYKLTPELTYSYFLSQGEYTDIDNQIVLQDDVNNLIMYAQRNDTDDLVFKQGLDFMTGQTFLFAEKTSQLPEPAYEYAIYPPHFINKVTEKAKTEITDEKASANRYLTRIFSDNILADLELKEDQTFTYHFLHYPMIHGTWTQENRLITLKTDSGIDYYTFIGLSAPDLTTIQIPGFLFNTQNNDVLYKEKR